MAEFVAAGHGEWVCAPWCGCLWLVGCGYLMRGLIVEYRKPGAYRPPVVTIIMLTIYWFGFCRVTINIKNTVVKNWTGFSLNLM
jgi:hypothetical protein